MIGENENSHFSPNLSVGLRAFRGAFMEVSFHWTSLLDHADFEII